MRPHKRKAGDDYPARRAPRIYRQFGVREHLPAAPSNVLVKPW